MVKDDSASGLRDGESYHELRSSTYVQGGAAEKDKLSGINEFEVWVG